MIMIKQTFKTLIIVLSSVAFSVALTGCFGGGNSGSNENIPTYTEQQIEIVPGAANKMCNDSLTLTVVDVQRRPVSVFQGGSVSGGTSSGTVGVESSNDVVLEVDLAISYNNNTLLASAPNAKPKVLNDLLQNGTLMYIQGVDQDGQPYISSSVITPEQQSDVDSLSINSQWDYNILNSELPDASDSKSGSILFEVSSQAKNLQLIIVTPNGNPDPLKADSVMSGTKKIYMLPLS